MNLAFPVLAFSLLALPVHAADSAKTPLKVFILAGQSNMEGHAKIETFDYIGDDPATALLLQEMRGPDGTSRVADDAWISYLTGGREGNGVGRGKLTAGYGSRQKPEDDGGKIGPEFTFGLTMDKALPEPVLILKTAWGGKSLHTDFRPPSAGPYVPSAEEVKNGKYASEEAQRKKAAETGVYYRLMIDHVKNELKNLERAVPGYDPARGYELAGFVWFQGWNDMVDRGVYPIPPKDSTAKRYEKYSEWLAMFIRDVRRELDAPRMPFVIGVMGVGGNKPNEHVAAFREAMAAPAALPEFRGNVVAVQTAPFWDEPLGAIADKRDQVRQMGHLLRTKNKNHPNADGSMTDAQQREYLKQFEAKLISPEEDAMWKRGASNAGYHYLGCAKTFALMGRAYAQALLDLMKANAAAR